MDAKEKVYEELNKLGIKYDVINHPPVYTIEEMDNIGINEKAHVCKNLFVRDEKGKKHYLIVLSEEKRADLKNIATQIGSTRLSFASDERLLKYMNLTKGSVTPLGIMNDINKEVQVVFDKDLVGKKNLGVHPNDNTSTVIMSFEDIKKVIDKNGNKVVYVKI